MKAIQTAVCAAYADASYAGDALQDAIERYSSNPLALSTKQALMKALELVVQAELSSLKAHELTERSC